MSAPASVAVVGLDLSLTSTGVARLITGRPQDAAEVTRVTSKPDPDQTLARRSLRLRRLAGDITTRCAGAGLVVVEGPSYASDSGKAHDRAGLWWLVVARVTGAGIPVVEVPPTTLKMYALGKGSGAGTGKDDVLTAVLRTYPDVRFSGNDEADALILAAMGARFAGAPIDDVPQSNLRAMKAVKWHR